MAFSEHFQKWQGVILSSSIILNVFLVGFLVARVGGPDAPRAPRAPMQMELRTLPHGISSQAKEEIEHEMRLHQKEMEQDYERIRELQEEINEITSDAEFSRGDLEEAFNEMAGLESSIKVQLRQAYVNAMRDMTRENRRTIVRERREGERTRVRRANRIDGSRWQFSIDDGRFEFDLEGLEGMEGLEGLKALEDLEIIISRDVEENGRDASRYIFIEKDRGDGEDVVVIEEETVEEDKDE